MKVPSILKPIVLLSLTFAALPMSVTFGAFLPMQPAPDGERFLFVVDMSADMEKLQAATEATMFDLIGSGIYGQMKPGDTFGLWTFNKETTAGRFSMQTWEPRRARQQATTVAAFLSGLEFEHSSDLKDVTQKLKSVVHSISNVTVLIVSDGDAPMKGTPFDRTINAEYKRQRKERKSQKRPFVTTLIARGGWIIDQSVIVAGNRIDLPPRPAPTAPTPPAFVANSVTNRIVSSPVVQGPSILITNSAPPQSKPAPKMVILSKPPAETPAPSPTTVAAPTVTPAAKGLVTTTNPTPTPTAPVTKPAEIASQESILAVANSSPASSTVQAAPLPTPTAPAAPPTSPAPTSSALAASTTAIESALAKFSPAPLTVAARETTTSTATPNPQPPTTLQGMSLPASSGANPTWMIAFGGMLLAAALLLGLAVLRRGRSASGSSLITRSMNRR